MQHTVYFVTKSQQPFLIPGDTMRLTHVRVQNEASAGREPKYTRVPIKRLFPNSVKTLPHQVACPLVHKHKVDKRATSGIPVGDEAIWRTTRMSLGPDPPPVGASMRNVRRGKTG